MKDEQKTALHDATEATTAVAGLLGGVAFALGALAQLTAPVGWAAFSIFIGLGRVPLLPRVAAVAISLSALVAAIAGVFRFIRWLKVTRKTRA